MKAASPYLTAEEAARYLRYDRPDGTVNMNAFYVLRCRLKKAGRPLRAHRLGGRMHFKQVDLDAAYERERGGTSTLRQVAG